MRLIDQTTTAENNDELLESKQVSTRHKNLHGVLKLSENLLHRIKYGQPLAECLRIGEGVLGHFHLSELDFQELEQDVLEQYSIAFA